jgi:hypothetical protein
LITPTGVGLPNSSWRGHPGRSRPCRTATDHGSISLLAKSVAAADQAVPHAKQRSGSGSSRQWLASSAFNPLLSCTADLQALLLLPQTQPRRDQFIAAALAPLAGPKVALPTPLPWRILSSPRALQRACTACTSPAYPPIDLCNSTGKFCTYVLVVLLIMHVYLALYVCIFGNV